MFQITLTAQALAERLGGALQNCPPERRLTRVMPLDEAEPDAVSFLANTKYHALALQSAAGLILGPIWATTHDW